MHVHVGLRSSHTGAAVVARWKAAPVRWPVIVVLLGLRVQSFLAAASLEADSKEREHGWRGPRKHVDADVFS